MKYPYDSINTIIDDLNENDGVIDWPNQDNNKDVYEEIKSKLKRQQNSYFNN